MKVSDKGLAEIAGHEGIVLKRYLDSVGVWTIGIGHTASAGDPNPSKVTRELSIAEVMEIFRRDIAKFETRVNKAVKVPLLQHEFDALVSFDFNTGGIYRAKLTKSLNSGNKVGAAKGFMGWLKPPEIKKRRTAEMNLFKSGRYGNGHASIFDTYSNGNVNWGSGRRVNVLAQMGVVPCVILTTHPPKIRVGGEVHPVPSAPHPKQQSIWTTLATLFRMVFRIGQ